MLNDMSEIRSEGLRDLLHAFGQDIIDCGGVLLLETNQVGSWNFDAAPEDPVAIEATMNENHVADLVGDLVAPAARDELMAVGRVLVRVGRIASRLVSPGAGWSFISEDTTPSL
jgi:hypothetical protein